MTQTDFTIRKPLKFIPKLNIVPKIIKNSPLLKKIKKTNKVSFVAKKKKKDSDEHKHAIVDL